MKLREKFKTEFSINTSGESGRFADKCEKITYEQMKKFAVWCFVNHGLIEPDENLLEIYKQEKGL